MLSWTTGHHLELMENGEEYFPRVFKAIRKARKEVLLETFIWFEDEVGFELREALLEAAGNGAQVHVLVDGFGSPDLSSDFIAPLIEAGVRLRSFDPQPTWLGIRANIFRRMHRKVVVVDGAQAFIGGINFSLEHLRRYGPESKQDYAITIQGDVVDDIRAYCLEELASVEPDLPRRPKARLPRLAAALNPKARKVAVCFAVRDRHRHPQDIERMYRLAIREAREEIVIANAYFFPAWSFMRELRRAARRGVRIRLVLQGTPDKAYVRWAAKTLYDSMLNDGFEVYEYWERPFHGKVAIIDGEWATVGSSNLDPLSFALNLEANLFLRDAEFAGELQGKVERLIADHCQRVDRARVLRQRGWRHLVRIIAFHVMRRFPRWSQGLVTREQPLEELRPETAPAAADPPPADESAGEAQPSQKRAAKG